MIAPHAALAQAQAGARSKNTLAKAQEAVAAHGKNIGAATLDAATLLDRVDKLGSIEPGKDADLIAVATSPLSDVTELERVRFVMRRGVVHKLDGARQAFPID
ncbi:MAG: amidohydrolase family protein [Steroidobacteraceae bacterium]